MGSGREQLGEHRPSMDMAASPEQGPAKPAAFLLCSSSNSHLGQGKNTSPPSLMLRETGERPHRSINLCLFLTGRVSHPSTSRTNLLSNNPQSQAAPSLWHCTACSCPSCHFCSFPGEIGGAGCRPWALHPLPKLEMQKL